MTTQWRTPGGIALWTTLICAVVCAAFFLAFRFFENPMAMPEQYRVAQAEFVLSHSDTPPAEQRDWQSTSLPGGARQRAGDREFQSAWYRVPLAGLPVAHDRGQGEPLVFYQPIPLANVDVYIDNQRIGSGGPMQSPLPFHVRQFHYEFALENPTPAAGSYLYFRVARQYGSAKAVATYVGPASAFRELHDHVELWGAYLPFVVVVVLVTIGIFMAFLYLLRPAESALGFHALVNFLWAFHIGHALVVRAPFDAGLWYLLDYLSLWWVILMPMFVHRFFALSRPRTEKLLLLSGVAGSAVLFVCLFTGSFRVFSFYANNGWLPFIQLWALYTLVIYAYVAWTRATFEAICMFVLGGLLFVVGVRDILFLVSDLVPGSTFYTQFAALLQMIVFTLLIARRFVASSNKVEKLNTELEQKVLDKSEELKQSYEKMLALERENTRVVERQRLMRDMHDGIGGQLVQALALSSRDQASDELVETIDNALGDLRMAVDSLATAENDLEALLAAYRHRVQTILDHRGIELRWHMDDLPEVNTSGSRALNILRTVQEAVTNVVRHSGADVLTIRTEATEPGVAIQIHDNGQGFDVETETGSPGKHGLANMRRRAEDLAGTLEIAATPDGTTITLNLPRSATRSGGEQEGNLLL